MAAHLEDRFGYRPHPLQVGRLLDGREGGSELVRRAEVPQRPVGQLPDETLAVRDGTLAVVLLQLVHHHPEAVDEAGGGNLWTKNVRC